MGIEIRDYDPAWRGLGPRAAGEVTAALPGVVTMAEHVGSTAVPGPAAKPVIDLMAAADDLAAVAARAGALHGIGYTRGKTALIQRMVDETRAARGLPRVDVWEE